MKVWFKKILKFIIGSLLSIERKKYFLNLIFELFRINPYSFALNRIGILNYKNGEVSGEIFVIRSILKRYFSKTENLLIFDVGANSGDYTKKLCFYYPKAIIYAFEPNIQSYVKLVNATSSKQNVNCVNKALGDQSTTMKINVPYCETQSEYSTFISDVLTDIHKSSNYKQINVEVLKGDDFCKSNVINHIHFLKIDTEGFELNVLKGFMNMLKHDAIDIIQFEFNEMNVYSRVFLKDFFDLLGMDFMFYRINQFDLIELKTYNTVYEIFKFQNILAINNRLLNV
jgi:FkbM family methyltransferase